MHTSILLATLALTLVTAAPQFPPHDVAESLTTPRPAYIAVISRNEVRDDSGQVISSYQSADGTSVEQVDILKPSQNAKKPKVIVQQGTYSYVSPDGTPVQVSYIADEKGFRAVGTHIFGEVPLVPDVAVVQPAPVPAPFSAEPPVPAPPPAPVVPMPLPVSFPTHPPAPAPAPFPVAFPPPPAPAPAPVPLPPATNSAVPNIPVFSFSSIPAVPGPGAPASRFVPSPAFPNFVRQF